MSATTEKGAAVRFPFPPALFAVPLAAALVADRRVRRLPLPGAGTPALTAAGAATVAAGATLMVAGASTVVRHHTTVVPHRPVTQLVTAGPYRFSRNPMYTGMAAVVTGVGLWTGSWWPFAATALATAATTQLVIRPEEAYLARRFGDDYARYRSRVRRWL